MLGQQPLDCSLCQSMQVARVKVQSQDLHLIDIAGEPGQAGESTLLVCISSMALDALSRAA